MSSISRQFPRGEWGWKFQALDATTLFVALENFRDGAILRSDDAGKTWRRIPINDRQRNGNLEGIGFVDGNVGWVGGWGDVDLKGGFTSATTDGGATWDNANEVGFRINRFRFVGSPLRVGYASGDTVYKFTDKPDGMLLAIMESDKARADIEGDVAVSIPFIVPAGARTVRVDLWERFGRHVTTLLQESSPAVGPRTVEWDFLDSSGQLVPIGAYILRVTTADDASWSAVVYRRQLVIAPHSPGGVGRMSLFASRKDWHAVCDVVHPFWTGPVRHTPHQANRDAHTHDISTHGGERTAVVISEP